MTDISSQQPSELEDKIEKLQAENKILFESLAANRKQQRDEIIQQAQAQGKITPPMLEAINGFADACGNDLNKFRNFIATLPSQTRPNAIGLDEPIKKETKHISEEDEISARIFGTTPEHIARLSNWQSVSTSGIVAFSQGNTLSTAELK